MSSKKERGQKLLLLLSKKQDYMTAKELANCLSTSPKTVYRLIKKLTMNFQKVHSYYLRKDEDTS